MQTMLRRFSTAFQRINSGSLHISSQFSVFKKNFMADNKNASKEFDNSGDKPLYVPGFGCDFNFQLDSEQRFQHGIEDAHYERVTAREVAMLQVMNKLTDKPDWREKVFDETIVAKWKGEATSMELISEKAFEWCLMELRDKAKGEGQYTVVLDASARCVKADGLVSEELRQDLNTAVQPLLDAPVKDWHPGSNEQVLNLIHPSLYPLVYGQTRVLKSGQVKLDNILEARDNTVIAPDLSSNKRRKQSERSYSRIDSESGSEWSKNYQWLPCDVEFAGNEGLEVKITSYINNLRFKGNEKLYGCVEKLISASIPLWNEVLEKDPGYLQGRTPRRIITREAEELNEGDEEWIESLPFDYEKEEVGQEKWDKAVQEVTEYLKKPDRPENMRKLESQEELPDDWVNGNDSGYEWGPRGAAQWKYQRLRRIVHPEPFFCSTYEDWKQGKARPWVSVSNRTAEDKDKNCDSAHKMHEVMIENSFRQKGLQVIVKVAGIELTPEKPTYEGGNWHLEGMANEHIVATAIYYFDVENVTESRIRYRQSAVLDIMDVSCGQDDFLPLEVIFDVDDLRNDKSIQEIGSIVTNQGRLLVFPNTRQHKVDPFELVDKYRPGHRRFIVLWLVDPHYRVLSTKNVPPQQYDWWKEKMTESVHSDERVPPEIQNQIDEELKNGTMTREQAEEHRLELMQERTNSTSDTYNAIEEYNFCEH